MKHDLLTPQDLVRSLMADLPEREQKRLGDWAASAPPRAIQVLAESVTGKPRRPPAKPRRRKVKTASN